MKGIVWVGLGNETNERPCIVGRVASVVDFTRLLASRTRMCLCVTHHQWHSKCKDILVIEESNSSKLNLWALAPMVLSTRPYVMTYPVLGRSSTPPSSSRMTLEQ